MYILTPPLCTKLRERLSDSEKDTFPMDFNEESNRTVGLSFGDSR